MELAARRFARRVLLAHFALLCIVLLAVGMAAKYVYRSARQQVIQQAEQTQKLLAVETAAGIDNYYDSIVSPLALLDPNEDPATTRPTSQPARWYSADTPMREQNLAVRRQRLQSSLYGGFFNHTSALVWDQIKDKCSMMFFVDPMDRMRIVRVIGKQEDDPTTPEIVANKAGSWLIEASGTHKKAISPFYTDISGGAHLLSIPRPNGLVMVAVVPIAGVEAGLLGIVNRSESAGTMLVDEQGTFVSSSMPGVRGKTVADLTNPQLREMAMQHMRLGIGATQILDNPGKIGDVQFRAAMTTIEPITVLSNKTWFVIISSDLAEVDQLLKPIFRDALIWSIVVVVSVMAILISTAVQMIRSRTRLEREQIAILNKELAQARQIQLNWLPGQPYELRGIEIAAINTPASHVSGDFYNWFDLSDGRLAVIIGDVTGHGMSAAFLMATTQLLVRTNMPRFNDPGFCLEEVNRQLCTQVFNGQFVTMLIMLIDVEKRTIDIASGGHPSPLVCQQGTVTTFDVDPQLVLGVESTTEYRTQRFTFEPGASLLLYTDGVSDVIAPSGERFTDARIKSSVEVKSESSQEMLDSVLRSIESFRTGRDLADDLTLVAIHFPQAAATIERLHPSPAAAK